MNMFHAVGFGMDPRRLNTENPFFKIETRYVQKFAQNILVKPYRPRQHILIMNESRGKNECY